MADHDLTPRTSDTVACPVSGDQAAKRPNYGDYVEYECPSWGTFRISRTVLVLAPEHPEILRKALEVAKQAARQDEVPLISNIVSG